MILIAAGKILKLNNLMQREKAFTKRVLTMAVLTTLV
jgi:hypothetical protein